MRTPVRRINHKRKEVPLVIRWERWRFAHKWLVEFLGACLFTLSMLLIIMVILLNKNPRCRSNGEVWDFVRYEPYRSEERQRSK